MKLQQEELLRLLALKNVPHVGDVMAKNLISYCGNAQHVFQEPLRNLMKIPGVGETVARNIREADFKKAEKEVEFIVRNQIRVFAYHLPDYPHRLKPFDDSPFLLFYKGNDVLNHARTVGIVGTRTPTDYGRLMCDKIVESLVPYSRWALFIRSPWQRRKAASAPLTVHRTATCQSVGKGAGGKGAPSSSKLPRSRFHLSQNTRRAPRCERTATRQHMQRCATLDAIEGCARRVLRQKSGGGLIRSRPCCTAGSWKLPTRRALTCAPKHNHT